LTQGGLELCVGACRASAMHRACCNRRQRPAQAPVPAAAPEPSLAEAFCSSVLTSEFWACLEERRPVHIQQAAARLPGLLGPDDVIAALTRGGDSGATASFKRGEPYLRENLFLAYLDQATLRLSDAERHLRPLLELCRALVPAFEYVTARLVLEPPECRGPNLHTESDLLLLQLWGEQRMTVRRPLGSVPMTAPRPGPLLAPELQPGDALLLPQGVECQVSSGKSEAAGGGGTLGASARSSEPVLYAVLTLRTGEQSFEASLGRYLTELLREGNFSPEADGFFRSAVTKQGVSGRYPPPANSQPQPAAATGELQQKLARSASELASRITAADFRRHFNSKMQQLREAQGKGAEELLAGSVAAGPLPPPGIIQAHSLVAVCSGIVCRCQPGSDMAYFKRGAETLNLPIAASASELIHRLCDGEPHAVGSLPCEDPVERLCVCQILVFKGCLEVTEGPGA